MCKIYKVESHRLSNQTITFEDRHTLLPTTTLSNTNLNSYNSNDTKITSNWNYCLICTSNLMGKIKERNCVKKIKNAKPLSFTRHNNNQKIIRRIVNSFPTSCFQLFASFQQSWPVCHSADCG